TDPSPRLYSSPFEFAPPVPAGAAAPRAEIQRAPCHNSRRYSQVVLSPLGDADIFQCNRHVRFTRKSRHVRLWANCGHDHSTTSSAIESRPAGMASPNAFAVLRLITNSNLVGRSTGRSAGFSPLRIAAKC